MRDLTGLTPFEERLAGELRTLAAGVTDARPAADIARVAMGTRRSLLPWWLPSPASGSLGRTAWATVLVAALLALAVLLGIAVVASRPNRLAGPNGLIVFPARPAGSVVPDIWAVAAGAAPNQIPSDPQFVPTCPAWAPDGRHLAYIETQSDPVMGMLPVHIVVADAVGSSPQQLLSLRAGEATSMTSLAWSPDGRQIAFLQDAAVRVVAVAGGPVRTIAEHVVRFSSAPWSSDGGRLAVEVNVGASTVLQTIAGDGTGARTLATIEASGFGGGYGWSPDGTAIAYTSGRVVWTIPDVSGADPIAVTSTLQPAATPVWSPDSRRLAFMDATPDGVTFNLSAVLVRDRSGGPATGLANLTSGTGPDGLTWSPDGRWLVYVERQWPIYRVLRVPTDGGPVEEIASFTGQGPMDSIADCPVSWQRLPINP